MNEWSDCARKIIQKLRICPLLLIVTAILLSSFMMTASAGGDDVVYVYYAYSEENGEYYVMRCLGVEDIAPGKYDCRGVSGSGNFMVEVSSLGFMGLNEILAEEGHEFYDDCVTYSNLRLETGML